MTNQNAILVLQVADENASCDDCLYYNQMEDCPKDEECIVRQAIYKAIKALDQGPKWIPVSERLPEDNGLYLVYTEEQPFVCSFKDGEFFIDEVFAWMPLPEPYKAESEVEE